jgi:hypothetical protein
MLEALNQLSEEFGVSLSNISVVSSKDDTIAGEAFRKFSSFIMTESGGDADIELPYEGMKVLNCKEGTPFAAYIYEEGKETWFVPKKVLDKYNSTVE